MTRSCCDRAGASDGDLWLDEPLFDRWYPSNEYPPDDRIVLIARVSPIGVALLRDIGYYNKIEGEWYTAYGDHLHPVKFWRPYPDLPNWR